MIGVLSIVAGTIAAFTIYNATYLRSDSWGSSAQQPIALLGAMFTAFVAGAATVHIGAAAGEARAARQEPSLQKAARLDQEAAKRNQEATQIRQAEAARKAKAAQQGEAGPAKRGKCLRRTRRLSSPSPEEGKDVPQEDGQVKG